MPSNFPTATTEASGQAEPASKPGVLLLIHPQTGDTFMARPGEGRLARHMILQGYEPIGPRGQAAAAQIRAQAEGRA